MPEIPYYTQPSIEEIQEEINARPNVQKATVKYMEPFYRISVSLRQRGTLCHFEIADQSLRNAERLAFRLLDASM